jgi:hypothetical protein
MAVSNTKLLKLDAMGIMRMQFAIAGISFTMTDFNTLSAQITASMAA